MYRTIIVPVDLTQEDKGRDIFERAYRLGEGEARIVLVNVLEEIPAYVAYELPADLMEESRRDAAAKLQKIADDASIRADVEVLIGHPASQILDLAEKMDADLIMVASHRPGLQDYFIGSTAGRVVRHANCSVLVAR